MDRLILAPVPEPGAAPARQDRADEQQHAVSGIMNASTSAVTLVVCEWWGVEPGVVSYDCPDLSTAQRVIRALRNAVRWFVVPGHRTTDEALAAEARGDVLLRAAVVPSARARAINP